MYKVFDIIHNQAINRKYKALTSSEIANKLKMSIQVTDNYLLRLFEMDLIRRERIGYFYVYI